MHMENQHTFDSTTLRARGGPADGEYYGLPWPCWGTAEMGHPGTAEPLRHIGRWQKAVFASAPDLVLSTEVDGVKTNLLAEGSYPVGSEIKDGYPEFTVGMIRKLGWVGDLTADEMAAIGRLPVADEEKLDKINWKVDLSGGIQRVAIKHGCAPFGNAKARAVVWTFPDPVPIHREPLYTNRRDLLTKYATYKDRQAPSSNAFCVHSEERLLERLPDDPDVWSTGGI